MRSILMLVAVVLLVVTACSAPAPAAATAPAPPISPTGAAAVFAGPGGTTMFADVFRPAGAGPFPAIAFIHGTEGFRSTHELQFAADVAAQGGLKYYEGAGHDLYYVAPTNADVALQIAAFFRRLAG